MYLLGMVKVGVARGVSSHVLSPFMGMVKVSVVRGVSNHGPWGWVW